MSTATLRQVPLLDLKAQHIQIRDEALAAVTQVIDSQKFILGEEVQLLEKEIAAYSSTRFGIGCASGSDALLLALMAAEIGYGDRVITTPFTFFATAGAIARLGAIPVFVDVDADTFNLNWELVEKALETHEKVRAIIPVHLFGACADMDPICRSAEARGVMVIEDAAQAIGSEYKGRRAGSIGQMGCFSFFPSKNLGCYGDGGMVTTNDPALAERLAALRIHGCKKKYVHDWVGVNSRLDALQAAVLRVKLRHLDNWSERRQKNAEIYRKELTAKGLPVILPSVAHYQTRHIYNQFVIRCQDRDRLQAFLKDAGIGTEVYYPLSLHQQKCFAYLGYKTGDFPISEKLAEEALALPINPEVTADDVRYVSETIAAFYGQSK
jgi:dTDP-4-amino-4,6-dideoxygalactose transaminase